jgi:diguanylate cyclase (GGDEF)-like protein
MIALSAPIEQALDQVVHLVESNVKETFGAILLVGDDGTHLRIAAAPNLTQAHRTAFDGVPIGPKAASYGAAIERRAWVTVANMTDDPLWRDRRQWLDEERFSSCWAIPIVSRHGAALGTLALHSRMARELTNFECDLVNRAARITALAVERKQADDRMHFMANHDPLTGLANRALLNDRLAQAALHARRYDRRFAVAFIDVDDFKSVNDTSRTRRGRSIAEDHRRSYRPQRPRDRHGGAPGRRRVCRSSDRSAQGLRRRSGRFEKTRAAIAQPVRLGGRRLAVTCSVGAANYPDDGTDFAALLAVADAAMYRTKKIGGGGGFQFRAAARVSTHPIRWRRQAKGSKQGLRCRGAGVGSLGGASDEVRSTRDNVDPAATGRGGQRQPRWGASVIPPATTIRWPRPRGNRLHERIESAIGTPWRFSPAMQSAKDGSSRIFGERTSAEAAARHLLLKLLSRRTEWTFRPSFKAVERRLPKPPPLTLPEINNQGSRGTTDR